MTYKIIELRPNRNLLDPNFNGYKLSLDPTPLLTIDLDSPPVQCQQREDQYSFLHAHIFGLENHLERDVWNPGSGYFIASDWNVKKIDRNIETGRINPIKNVYKVPRLRDVIKGDYNPNIKFLTENLCLISDGIGNIYLTETNIRNSNTQWTLILTIKPFDDDKCFILKDARINVTGHSKEMHLLLLHIVQESSTFYSTLEWFKYKLQEKSVEKISQQTLRSKGVLNYVSLESNCSSIIISTDKAIDFIYDDENPVVTSNGDELKEELNEVGYKTDIYSWSQTIDEIFINFHYKHESESFDYNILCENNKLLVKIKDKTIADLDLCGNVITDSIAKAWEVCCINQEKSN